MERLIDLMTSEEGKKSMEKYFLELARKEHILNRQLDNFHIKFGSEVQFSFFVEKVISKYESDEYKNRWYNRCIEPPDYLYWFLYRYAVKYGKECTDNDEFNKYGNIFTTGLYFVNGYYFNKMDGQGSIILIQKENKDE